jgi:hypothetical protein
MRPVPCLEIAAKPPPELPLLLSQAEAETLVSLCLTSIGDGGAGEHPLFVKLGEFLRGFYRASPERSGLLNASARVPRPGR